MAHFVLAIDPDPEERRRFLGDAEDRLRSLPGLTVGRAEVGDLVAAWGHGPTAPHGVHAGASEFGLLLGYALDDAGERWDARRIAERWTQAGTASEALDGYFVAAAYSVRDGLVAGADVLGFFPLHYAVVDGALVAGTSPDLFAAHPRFSPSLDLRGLAGILMTNGLVGGQALLRGVRRVGAGHVLRWERGRGAREVEVSRLEAGDGAPPRAVPEVREAVGEGLLRAIRRHRPPDGASALMLSGGLDSRLMAGCLRSEGITDLAVTLGRATDFDVTIAVRVARALDLRVVRQERESKPDEFREFGRRVARWEHLAAGFGGLETLASAEVVGGAAPWFWSGFALDETLGGDASKAALERGAGTWTWERFLDKTFRWGLAPSALRSLLRGAGGEAAVEETLGALRADYERPGERPWQRSFRMRLATRVRFHIAAIVHRLSFRSWPVLPVLDRRFLDLLFQAPPEVLVDRRVEKELLLRRFPQVAAIPREHNSFRFESLAPRGSGGAAFLRDRGQSLRKSARRWYWQRWRRIEPRRYYRLFDLDGPSWRAVRDDAEPHRARLGEWLDGLAVDRLLPPPHVALGLRQPISDGAVPRSLLGLMLWSAPR